VDEVQYLSQVAAEPDQGVHHDPVPGPGVDEQFGQAGAVDRRAGLFVGVDPRLQAPPASFHFQGTGTDS
jgi:hypothetical protein